MRAIRLSDIGKKNLRFKLPLPEVDFCFTTNDFRWLNEEAWNDSHYSFYVANYQVPPCSLFQPAPLVLARTHPPPSNIGAWLLEFEHGVAAAWATAQVHQTHFTNLLLLVGVPKSESLRFWQKNRHALAFLISALIIATRADKVTLVGSQIDPTSPEEFAWGRRKTVWIASDGRFHPLPEARRIPITEIDPPSWWKSAEGQENQKQLRYLEKRLTPRAVRKSRVRKGFLSRFLTWR